MIKEKKRVSPLSTSFISHSLKKMEAIGIEGGYHHGHAKITLAPKPLISSSGSSVVKVIMMGDVSVGKSSLCLRYNGQPFTTCSQPTICVDFIYRKMQLLYDDLPGAREVLVLLMDTAGAERFHAMTTAYIRGSRVILLVFSLVEEQSWKSIKDQWYGKTVVEMVSPTDLRHGNVILALVGNKSDMISSKTPRCVSREDAVHFAHAHNMCYFETSAFEEQCDIEKILYTCITALNRDTIIKQGDLSQRWVPEPQFLEDQHVKAPTNNTAAAAAFSQHSPSFLLHSVSVPNPTWKFHQTSSSSSPRCCSR